MSGIDRHRGYFRSNIRYIRSYSIIINGKRMGVHSIVICPVCDRKFMGKINMISHIDKEHRY